MKKLLPLLLCVSGLAFSQSQLKISSDSTYFLDQSNTPVFLNVFSPWGLFADININEAKRFLDSMATHKVNAINVVAPSPSGFGSYTNRNGDNPWQGSQTFASTINEVYWTHVDSVIGYAKTKGVYVFMYVDYLGGNDGEAWRTHTTASTADQMKTWGNTMGSRYKDSSNVLWMIGGDTDPTTWQTKLDSLAAGIKASGSTQLIGTRDEYPATGDTHWAARSWWKINGAYQYWGTTNAQLILSTAQTMRSRKPVRPSGLLEATFEDENDWSATIGRQQMFYSILGGSLGYQTTGNCPLWHFNLVNSGQCGVGSAWTGWLNSTNFINQRIFWQVVQRNRKWWAFAPDTSNTVLTAGKNTGNDQAVCSWATDGSTIMVYMPSNRQVTMNTNSITSGKQVVAAWIDPATGDSTYIGTYARSGSQNFTPSGAHDWVLVLDREPDLLSRWMIKR